MNVLTNQLIRPYRFLYNMIDLGKKKTSEYQRQDSYILNDRAQRIYYSYYKNHIESDTCVVYAHCNSGCRVEGTTLSHLGLQYLKYFIEKGWNVVLFDFSGSGLSEGDTISLGYQEARDLKLVVEEMQRAKGNRMFMLWGRSMGASTIIFYLSEFPDHASIIGCVLDSPYCCLWRLSLQIGSKMTGMPNFLLTPILSLLRNKILTQHSFDIKHMSPLSLIKSLKCPILFITSLKDQLVSSQHVVELYKAYDGVKRLEYIESTHNSSREGGTIRLATEFLEGMCRKKRLQWARLEARGEEMARRGKQVVVGGQGGGRQGSREGKENRGGREIRKFKSFKIIRENQFKENYDVNHQTQHNQDQFQEMIASKLNRKRCKISQLQHSKLLM